MKDIFAHARALPPDARVAYLTEVCGGDESLRHEVESLLTSDERAEGFLEALPQLSGEATEHLEGRCIGAYQIGCRIGAGGMGERKSLKSQTLTGAGELAGAGWKWLPLAGRGDRFGGQAADQKTVTFRKTAADYRVDHGPLVVAASDLMRI